MMRRERLTLICRLLLVFVLLLASVALTLPGQAPKQADVRIKPSQTTIDRSVGEDKEVKEIVNKYADRIRSEMRVVIGRASQNLEKGLGGGSLGAFVADVIKRRAEELSGRKIHLALQNAGGLRRSIPRGEITVGMIYELMPFENQIVVCDITGQQVLKLIERLVERASERSSDALSGAMIIACEGKVRRATVEGKPIDPQAIYTLATSDYLQQGGAGYTILTEARNVSASGLTIRQALLDYIRAERAAGRQIEARFGERFKIECQN